MRLLSLALVFIAACSRISTVHAPTPIVTNSVVFKQEVKPSAWVEYHDDPYSVIAGHYDEYEISSEPNRIDRALTKAAKIVNRMHGSTLETVIDRYTARIDSIEEKYTDVEEFVTEHAGIRRGEFRQGLGVTTMAAVTTLGALHVINPSALSPEIFGTKVRAGYDVTRLDDPRIILSYDKRLNVIMGKDGLGGRMTGATGITYGADLNVRRASATADLTMPSGVTLGTIYSHRAQEVKGFVRFSF